MRERDQEVCLECNKHCVVRGGGHRAGKGELGLGRLSTAAADAAHQLSPTLPPPSTPQQIHLAHYERTKPLNHVHSYPQQSFSTHNPIPSPQTPHKPTHTQMQAHTKAKRPWGALLLPRRSGKTSLSSTSLLKLTCGGALIFVLALTMVHHHRNKPVYTKKSHAWFTSFKRDEEGMGEWLQGCKFIYIDVGSNRGIQVRKIFEPNLYPEADVLPVFEKVFGKNWQQRPEVRLVVWVCGHVVHPLMSRQSTVLLFPPHPSLHSLVTSFPPLSATTILLPK